MPDLSPELEAKHDRLIGLLRGLDRCVVAFSGGVDSAVVAKAAYLALGDRAVAVTAESASLASGELDEAKQVAQLIGIPHQVVHTHEFERPGYIQNSPDRCFHCKTELYTELTRWLPTQSHQGVIVNGANLDDRGDHRPGMIAASQHGVRSPLLECELTKADVRALAAHWNLPIWDKPAAPCLSSRIAYGEEVTPQRVAMIDAAERILRELGLRELRVRYHRGDLARLEVPLSALPKICSDDVRSSLVRQLRDLGFKYVTIDLEGFRSGSLNDLVPIESLRILNR